MYTPTRLTHINRQELSKYALLIGKVNTLYIINLHITSDIYKGIKKFISQNTDWISRVKLSHITFSDQALAQKLLLRLNKCSIQALTFNNLQFFKEMLESHFILNCKDLYSNIHTLSLSLMEFLPVCNSQFIQLINNCKAVFFYIASFFKAQER